MLTEQTRSSAFFFVNRVYYDVHRIRHNKPNFSFVFNRKLALSNLFRYENLKIKYHVLLAVSYYVFKMHS